MTGHDLRIVAPGELSAPRVDDDSLEILNEAIEALARRRTPTGSATPASASTP
jgi:hypothetical protein